MVTLHTKKLNDHGVSESIGFILIFAIIIVGIGLVTLYGYPLLIQQQVSADEKIMEKNMIVLQNDMKSLAYKTVPFKETALKIGGGSLIVYNSLSSPSSPRMTISNGATNYVNLFQPGELRYESVSARTDISLQNGAVIMRPRNDKGSTMLSEPRWFYDVNTKTMVINLINITSDNIMAKEGIGNVQMTLGDTKYYISPVIGRTVYVDLVPPDSDYSVAWDNYFTKSLGMDQETHGVPGSYTLTNVDTLVIKTYEVKIKNI